MDAISWEMLSNNTSQAVSLESSVCPDLASREHVVGVPDNHVLRQDSAGLYIYILYYIIKYSYMYYIYADLFDIYKYSMYDVCIMT